ncbi:MAG: hypothetical protein DCC67_15250 [Planctomycetota bacterium]|nr:MAG: hypothetical protein DCC67_15250 [Planctomycetota bacterium]
MQAFVAQVTVAALLAHAAAGCCWHHQHFSESSAQPPAVKPVICGGHFSWNDVHHQDGAGESSPSHHHDDHRGCGEAKCNLAHQNVRPQVQAPTLDYCAATIALGGKPSPGTANPAAAAALGGRAAPPVPLHLLLGVLLI